jgi:hypothetical protein
MYSFSILLFLESHRISKLSPKEAHHKKRVLKGHEKKYPNYFDVNDHSGQPEWMSNY